MEQRLGVHVHAYGPYSTARHRHVDTNTAGLLLVRLPHGLSREQCILPPQTCGSPISPRMLASASSQRMSEGNAGEWHWRNTPIAGQCIAVNGSTYGQSKAGVLISLVTRAATQRASNDQVCKRGPNARGAMSSAYYPPARRRMAVVLQLGGPAEAGKS